MESNLVRDTIFVVDDDPAVLEYAAERAGRMWVRSAEAAEGANALVLLRSNRPIDLLFTDLVMPEIDGIELVRRARAEIPDLKVLFTSGSLDRSASQGPRLLRKALRAPAARRCDCGRTCRSDAISCTLKAVGPRPSLHLQQRPRDEIDRPEQRGGKGDRNLGKPDCPIGARTSYARGGKRNRRRPPPRRDRARSARSAGPCEALQTTRMFLNCHGSSRSRSSANSLSRPARGVQSPCTPTISPR